MGYYNHEFKTSRTMTRIVAKFMLRKRYWL